MERYEDEVLCRCGSWVSITILRESPRVQFSSSGVVCTVCAQMEVHLGYNWIARQVAYVRYLPLSVNTKPQLIGPPRLRIVRPKEEKRNAVQTPRRTQVPRRRRLLSPVR